MPPPLSFVHPQTHSPLARTEGGYRDAATGDFFPDQGGVTVGRDRRDGVPSFVPASLAGHMDEERSGILNWVKTLLRKSPGLYLFLIWLISPVCFTGISAKRFLKRCKPEALMLNIGSGVHKPHPDILNVDIFYYKGVDIVANGEQLPFATGSVDAVVCESLLEHVPRPERIVAEMFRVLRPDL